MSIAPLSFPPLATLTPTAASMELAKTRFYLSGREGHDKLAALAKVAQRLARSVNNGLLDGHDITDRLWEVADAEGLVTEHGADRIENVLTGAYEAAESRPNDDPDRYAGGIKITPYTWTEPETLPQRDWLYGNVHIRKFPSATVATGGVGKSSLITAEALAMVSARALLGVTVARALRGSLWNLEDPAEEQARKVQAAAKHYGLTAADIEDRLFIDCGRDQRLVIATAGKNGAVISRPIVESLVEQLRDRRIDVLIVDPFVSSHEVGENDNSAIDMVAKEWGRVADKANCAVHLVHHTRKQAGDVEITTDSSRGGKALTDACRVVRVVNRMTKEEGDKANVENYRLYFRTMNDKANLAPPVDKSEWFKLEKAWRSATARCPVSAAIMSAW